MQEHDGINKTLLGNEISVISQLFLLDRNGIKCRSKGGLLKGKVYQFCTSNIYLTQADSTVPISCHVSPIEINTQSVFETLSKSGNYI